MATPLRTVRPSNGYQYVHLSVFTTPAHAEGQVGSRVDGAMPGTF
jgi:hypothetical protein